MSNALDMSLDDLIKSSKKSAAGAGGGGSRGRGRDGATSASRPGPARPFPSRAGNRSKPCGKMKACEHQQQIQMHQLKIMQQRHAQMQWRDASHPPLPGSINGMGSDRVLGQSTASVLAAKMYEDRMKQPNSVITEPFAQLLDANRMALLKSSNQGQLVQGTPSNASATLQQIQKQTQQTVDVKVDVSLAATQRPLSWIHPFMHLGFCRRKA